MTDVELQQAREAAGRVREAFENYRSGSGLDAMFLGTLVPRLLAEVERLRRENAAYFEDNCRLHNEQAPERTERRLALAEVERMRPVFEAAIAWRKSGWHQCPLSCGRTRPCDECTLYDACDVVLNAKEKP